MTEKKDIYLGLGSNIGDKAKNIQRALHCLCEYGDITIVKVSSLIVTAPVGGVVQPDFMNAVVKIRSSLKPYELLEITQGIEKAMGRVPTVKNGPRIIDVDILLYGDKIIETQRLHIPHPRMFERDFVLKPLFEIEPLIASLLERLKADVANA